MGTPPPSTSVWVAPYLWLENRLEVGGWEVIPADLLQLEDCTGQHALDQARGLIELYRRPRRVPDSIGCFLRGRDEVGASSRNLEIRGLHRALLVAVLDKNTTPWYGTTNDLNWGWRTSTSDCLFFVWHGIQPDGHVVTQTGALTSTLEGGLRIGQPTDDLLLNEIQPPLEQPFPQTRPPDADYFKAILEALELHDPASRRLAASIDWLDLAWRNTPSLTDTTRILIMKAGFEALLGANHRLTNQRRALVTLLGRKAGRSRLRQMTDWRGNPQAPEWMRDVEWWYTRFAWLRNAIAHGRSPARRDWRHGRAHHFWLSDHWLRISIRYQVAALTGKDELRAEGPYERALLLALRQAAGA